MWPLTLEHHALTIGPSAFTSVLLPGSDPHAVKSPWLRGPAPIQHRPLPTPARSRVGTGTSGVLEIPDPGPRSLRFRERNKGTTPCSWPLRSWRYCKNIGSRSTKVLQPLPRRSLCLSSFLWQTHFQGVRLLISLEFRLISLGHLMMWPHSFIHPGHLAKSCRHSAPGTRARWKHSANMLNTKGKQLRSCWFSLMELTTGLLALGLSRSSASLVKGTASWGGPGEPCASRGSSPHWCNWTLGT